MQNTKYLVDPDNKIINRNIISTLIVFTILLYSCEDNIIIDNPRLTADIINPTEDIQKGLSNLNFDGRKAGKLYVPQSYSPNRKMPLLIALHGSGGSSYFWKSY